MTLIGINVGIYLLQLAGGASVNANSGWIFEHGALYGPLVAQGDWYRLLTAAFLHYGPFHLGLNMLALWWIGRPLESYLGSVRFLLLYLVSGLAGSAGALLVTPTGVTVGASGAIYGILGAAIVLERQGTYVLGGAALPLLIVNLAFTLRRAGHLDRRPPRRRGRRRALHPRALAAWQGKRCVQADRPLSVVSLLGDRRHQRRDRVLEGARLRLARASRRSRLRRCPARSEQPGRRRDGRAERDTGSS